MDNGSSVQWITGHFELLVTGSEHTR